MVRNSLLIRYTYTTHSFSLCSYSVLPALSLNGIISCQIVEGSFNSQLFGSFIEGILDCMNPFPLPNSVIVMDNCHMHKDPEVLDWIKARGMWVEFLPPYSSEINPIEQAFSVIKARLDKNGYHSGGGRCHLGNALLPHVNFADPQWHQLFHWHPLTNTSTLSAKRDTWLIGSKKRGHPHARSIQS